MHSSSRVHESIEGMSAGNDGSGRGGTGTSGGGGGRGVFSGTASCCGVVGVTGTGRLSGALLVPHPTSSATRASIVIVPRRSHETAGVAPIEPGRASSAYDDLPVHPQSHRDQRVWV